MKAYLSLVKFSHTIFALPFALLGYFLAMGDQPTDFALLLKVVLCMVFARSAAMAFNRWADRDIDALNPRTAIREIPAGVISNRSALGFVVFNALAFIATTWFINFLCFVLSPVALLVIFGYSYMKRISWLCHIVLGIGLGLAPVGAWLAVTGRFDVLPILLGFAVMTWVSGFDIIYALQDADFDKKNNLRSIPSAFGAARALNISRFLHLCTAILLFFASQLMHARYPALGVLSWIALAAFVGLLIFQHRLVRPDDLSRVNLAFFTTNGVASLLFGTLVISDLFL